MRNNFLAQSLAQHNANQSEPKALEPSAGGGPKALRTMANAIENLTSNAPQDLDPHQIADSQIEDRIDTLDGLDSLIDSIRTSGQKLPILVRHRKANSGPIYEVVYGRRRLAASRALGIKVKAFVREMDQTEALMSQALENSARLDRSFIEQALFAHRLSEAGLTAEQIIEGLAINPTLYKRLLSVSRAVPAALILAIGAAHEAGRRPWLELKDLIKANADLTPETLCAMVKSDLPSYERLTSLISALKDHEAQSRARQLEAQILAPKAALVELPLSPQTAQPSVEQSERTVNPSLSEAAQPSTQLSLQDDEKSRATTMMVGSVTFSTGHKRAILSAGQKQDRAFLDYLATRLEDLYAEWRTSEQTSK